MVDKKKILFFMWSFSLGGGAEKILSTIVSNLDPEKYDIDILEMEHFDKGYEPVPENVRILKAFQDYRQPRWLRALLWRLRIYFPRLTRRLLVKDQYDVEVSFTIMNPPLLFSKRKEVKKISWIHGSIEEFLTDSGQAFFEIGFNQGASVQRIFSSACPNRKVTIHKDIAGLDRMIIVSGKEAQ